VAYTKNYIIVVSQCTKFKLEEPKIMSVVDMRSFMLSKFKMGPTSSGYSQQVGDYSKVLVS